MRPGISGSEARTQVGRAACPHAAASSSPRPRVSASSRLPFPSQRGTVLFEVVLALVLFVVAAAIVAGGMNASLDTVERLRLNTHAGNLAISVLSELQMGVRSTEMLGPEAFEPPFENWTWELLAAPIEEQLGESNRLTKVEVIVRHKTEPVVYRLTQALPMEDLKREQERRLEDLPF